MNILIPVITGSEIRQFFLSSIASNLINKENRVFTITKYNNIQIREELILCDERIKILPYIVEPIDGTKFSYLRFLLDEVYDIKNIRWRYSSKSKHNKIKKLLIIFFDFLFKLPYIFKLVSFIERRWMTQINVNKMENLLSENSIDKVIVSNARFLYYPELLIACDKKNIPVEVVYHSNKEIYAQPRINYNYNKYGLWNEQMLAHFVQKNPLFKNVSEVIGNSHFTYLLNNDFLIPINEFKQEFNIQKDDVLILYTAAGVIVQNENFIVDWISDFMKNKKIQYKIIVRKNPMDSTTKWDDYFIENNNVVIQTPKWVNDSVNGINFTKQDDLIEYNSLLSYASFCINIPSTVTIECAIKKKPVINIAFDFPNVKVETNNKKITQFWDAPFYREYHDFDFVLPAFSIKQLGVQIDKCINQSLQYNDYEKSIIQILGLNFDNTTKIIENFILSKK
jgi:hypothetical protein